MATVADVADVEAKRRRFAEPLRHCCSSRNRLPAEMQSRDDFSICSFLKSCIGKELTKVTMPVILNEPLSFLQRLSEYLEYSHLLFQAASSEDPVQRLELLAAFAVSAASSNWNRLNKPFNPLLGETFELDRGDDRGFRIVCEQVSHHPPVSAFHAEAVDGSWTFHGSISPKLTFWGKSIEINPKGYVTVEFPHSEEVYTWHNVQCKIHNIIVGKLWIENLGDLVISSHSNGYRAELRWHSSSWTSSDSHRVDGYILDSGGKKLRALYGTWVDAMYSLPVESWKSHKRSSPSKRRSQAPTSNGSCKGDGSRCSQSDGQSANGEEAAASTCGAVQAVAPDCDLKLDGQRLLWKVAPRPDTSDWYYGFTYFALALNDDSDEALMSRLPPTDSRRKPDIRALELGQHELAETEKTRLEEAQRRRQQAEAEGKWFQRWANPHTAKDSDWLFTGAYWRRDWSDCADIF